jgi:hypothetical protein
MSEPTKDTRDQGDIDAVEDLIADLPHPRRSGAS